MTPSPQVGAGAPEKAAPEKAGNGTEATLRIPQQTGVDGSPDNAAGPVAAPPTHPAQPTLRTTLVDSMQATSDSGAAATLPHDQARAQAMATARVVAAAEIAAAVEAETVPQVSPRPGLLSRRRLHHLLSPATLGFVVSAAVPAAVAYATSPSGPVVWWAAGGVALLLLLEFASIPHYERARSMRPAKHLIWFGAAFLISGMVADKLTVEQVQAAFAVLAPAIAISAGSVLLQRHYGHSGRTLLVGDAHGVDHLAQQWVQHRAVDVRGICLAVDEGDAEAPPTQIHGVPVVGTVQSVPDVAREMSVDKVVVVPGRALTAIEVRRLGWALAGARIELAVATGVDGAVPHRVETRMIGESLLLSVRPGTRSFLSLVIKNAIDRLGAALLLTVLSPLLLLVAVLVRLDSPGPVIFRQVRVGQASRSFRIWKFRTMVIDAEEKLEELKDLNEGAGPLFKMQNDPRVTRVGGLLRRSSLDELPQLVNVLKGEMSLIGPRPALPSEAEEYDDWIRHRLTVKPGMTGSWQVNGRSNLDWQDGVRLDLHYVDNQTLAGDLMIAAKTVRAVFKQDGAA